MKTLTLPLNTACQLLTQNRFSEQVPQYIVPPHRKEKLPHEGKDSSDEVGTDGKSRWAWVPGSNQIPDSPLYLSLFTETHRRRPWLPHMWSCVHWWRDNRIPVWRSSWYRRAQNLCCMPTKPTCCKNGRSYSSGKSRIHQLRQGLHRIIKFPRNFVEEKAKVTRQLVKK